MQQQLHKLTTLEQEIFINRDINCTINLPELLQSVTKISNLLSTKMCQVQMMKEETREYNTPLFYDRGLLGLFTIALLRYCSIKGSEGLRLK
jgi:hypothetical protein